MVALQRRSPGSLGVWERLRCLRAGEDGPLHLAAFKGASLSPCSVPRAAPGQLQQQQQPKQQHAFSQHLQQQQQQQRRGFGFVRPHVWRRALPAAVSSVGSLGPSALCGALREAAAKGLSSGLFWKEADRRLLFLASSLSPAALAAAAAALATAAHRNTEVLQRLQLRAIQVKNEFDSLQAALLLNAFARLQWTPHELLPHFAEMLIRRDKELLYEPRAFALLANSFARFGYYDRVCMDVLCRRAERQIEECSAQDVSNLFNALHRLQHEDGPLFVALQRRCLRVAAQLSPQHISNSLGALAANGQPVEQQAVHTLCDEIPEKIQRFSPQEVAVCCSALSALRFEHRAAAASLFDYLLRHAERFSSTQAVLALHAAANLKHTYTLPAAATQRLLQRLVASVEELEPAFQVLLLHAAVKLGLADESLLDALGAAIAEGPLLNPRDASDSAAAAAAVAAEAAAGGGVDASFPSPQQQQQQEQQQQDAQQKVLVMLLHAYATARRRHPLCDKIFTLLAGTDAPTHEEAEAGISSSSSSNSSSSRNSSTEGHTSGSPAAGGGAAPTAAAAAERRLLSHADAALVALSLGRLKAFDRIDVIRAIDRSVAVSDALSFSPQQTVNLLFALQQVQQHLLLGKGEGGDSSQAGETFSLLQRSAAVLASHATLSIKRLSPQLLGSAALSVARVAPPGGPQHRLLCAAAHEVPLLALEGSGGLHASVSLLAALAEGVGASRAPLLGVGAPSQVKEAVTLLLRRCALNCPKMTPQQLLLFTAATANLRLNCMAQHYWEGSSNSSSTSSSSSESRLRAAVEAAGVEWLAFAAALKAQERGLFSRVTRADTALLCAFMNAAAPPSPLLPAAAAAVGETLQQQQRQAEQDAMGYAQQQFLPLQLLRKETAAEVYRQALPRHLSGDPACLLQHWGARAAAVVAVQQQQQAAAAEEGGAGEALGGSAADFLIGELRHADTPEVLKTPHSYVRYFIALAQLAQPEGGGLSAQSPQQQRQRSSSSSSSTATSSCSSSSIETGPERILAALLHPVRSSPAAFSPSACAAFAKVAMETGVGDALLLEKILRRLSTVPPPLPVADSSSSSSSNSSSSSSSSSSDGGVPLLPAAAFLDVLKAAAAAAAITRPAREALEALVEIHTERLLQRADLAAEAVCLLQRLELLQLHLLARVVVQQLSRVQQQLQQQLQQRQVHRGASAAAVADLGGLALCMQSLAANAAARQAMRKSVPSATTRGPPLEGELERPSRGTGGGPPQEAPPPWGPQLLSACTLTAELVAAIQAAHSSRLLQIFASPEQQQYPQQHQQQQQLKVIMPPGAILQLLHGCAALPCRRRAAQGMLALMLLLQRSSSSSSSSSSNQQGPEVVCEALRVAAEALTCGPEGPSPAVSSQPLRDEAPSPSQVFSLLAALTAVPVGEALTSASQPAEAAAAAAAAVHATPAALLEKIAAAGELLLRQQVLPHFSLLRQQDLLSLAAWYTALLLLPPLPAAAAAAAGGLAAAATVREERMQGLLKALRSFADSFKGQSLAETDRRQLALVLSFLRHEAFGGWRALGPAAQQRLLRLSSSSSSSSSSH
ncbi:hypothetical protein Efla_001765 [Eimeria flavescens]